MASFADELAPALSSTLKGMQAPLPPPPKGTFADGLAAFFGGGPDLAGSYDAGIAARGKTQAQSAQTLSALAEAEKRRTEAVRQSQINDLMAKAGADPAYKPTLADMLVSEQNPIQFGLDPLSVQEQGFRSTLGDPNAAPAAAFAAGQGVQGKVLPQVDALGAGREINLLTQKAYTNPIGDAQIANYQEKPAAGGAAGQFTLGNTRYNADGTPLVVAPPSASPTMLGRERMFAERVRVAGESVADTLENIAQMPVGASTGVMGIGASPGKSILQATKDTLRNAAAGGDVQMYTAALAGANRALAVLESAGLAPSGTSQQSFEALSWRAGDTEGARLYKLAEMRQTVDNAMATALTNPGITPEMKAQVEVIQRRVGAAIPFSPIDIILLERGSNVLTLGDILKQRGIAQGTATPAAPAAPGGTPPLTNAKGWKLKKRTNNGAVEYAYLGPNGEVEMVH